MLSLFRSASRFQLALGGGPPVPPNASLNNERSVALTVPSMFTSPIILSLTSTVPSILVLSILSVSPVIRLASALIW